MSTLLYITLSADIMLSLLYFVLHLLQTFSVKIPRIIISNNVSLTALLTFHALNSLIFPLRASHLTHFTLTFISTFHFITTITCSLYLKFCTLLFISHLKSWIRSRQSERHYIGYIFQCLLMILMKLYDDFILLLKLFCFLLSFI